MTDFETQEFWKGLGRLYDSCVALERATSKLYDTAQSHEKRLDKLEVIVQWLAEKERNREKNG